MTDEGLREWAHAAPSLALKQMAADHGMPGVHGANKHEAADWLLEHHPDVLAESRRLSTRKEPDG